MNTDLSFVCGGSLDGVKNGHRIFQEDTTKLLLKFYGQHLKPFRTIHWL